MHDQPRMRMRHRIGDLQEQAQALRHVELMLAAVHVDGLAADALHRHPGPAGRGDACVVQPRDARVLQRAQDVALARHALRQAHRPAGARQLERHVAAQHAIGTLGQPDGGHAAGTQLADQPVRADLVAGLVGLQVAVGQVVCRERHRPLQKRVGLDRRARQQRAQQRHECLLFGRQRAQPGVALVPRQRQRRFEQGIEAAQAIGVGCWSIAHWRQGTASETDHAGRAGFRTRGDRRAAIVGPIPRGAPARRGISVRRWPAAAVPTAAPRAGAAGALAAWDASTPAPAAARHRPPRPR